MNQIKKKLHSNAGASIILAMALLLICVMVSSVIVAAAASGLNRNEVELKKQQEYLAITSAAQYIAENLNPTGNDRFCGVQLKNEKPCNKYKNYVQSVVHVGNRDIDVYAISTPYASLEGNELATVDVLQFYLCIDGSIFCNNLSEKNVIKDEGATIFYGLFKDMMEEAATKVYLNNETYSREFTISVEDSRIPDVKCTFKMDAEYHVKVLVQSASGDSEYSMIVELPAFSPIEDTAGWRTIETCQHKCIYEYCDDTGNVQFSPEKEFTFTHEVDNTTMTITWGTPVIKKGGSGL